MVKKLLYLVTTITSFVCFAELVKDKKQYRSLAFVIVCIMTFLFIRPILVLWIYAAKNIMIDLIIFNIITLLLNIIIKTYVNNKKFSNNYSYTDEVSKNFCSVLFSFTSLVVLLENVDYYIVSKYPLSFNKEHFLYENDLFLKELKLRKTSDELYEIFLWNNLKITIMNVYLLIITLFALCFTLYAILCFFMSEKQFEKYYLEYRINGNIKYIFIILFLTIFVTPSLTEIIDYIFEEFEYFSPNVEIILFC